MVLPSESICLKRLCYYLYYPLLPSLCTCVCHVVSKLTRCSEWAYGQYTYIIFLFFLRGICKDSMRGQGKGVVGGVRTSSKMGLQQREPRWVRGGVGQRRKNHHLIPKPIDLVPCHTSPSSSPSDHLSPSQLPFVAPPSSLLPTP